jgi:hypothetical protein
MKHLIVYSSFTFAFLLSTFCAAQTHAGINLSATLIEPAVTWKKDADSNLIDKARKLIARNSKRIAVTELFFHQDIEISDRWVKHRVKHILFLPDSQAINDYGTEIIYFNKNTERVKLNTVAAINASGKVQKMHPESLKVLDSDSYNTFRDSKKIVLAVPGLEPVSMMLIDYEVVQDRYLLEMGYADFIGIKYTYEREDFSVSVHWNKDNDVAWGVSGDDIQCVQTTIYALHCEAASIPALVSDKAVYWSDVLARLVVAEKNSWEQAVNYSLRHFAKANEGGEAVNQLIAQLTKENDSTEQKIEKTYQFVARNIRYTSFSGYGHTITPHTFNDVINNKYGDSKDKSALLVAILKRLGIKAYPVLVATQRKRISNVQLPALSYFNHMVVCFKYKNTKYCLDPTDYYTDWKTTSDWIQGKVALELIKGTNSLITIDSAEYRWDIQTVTDIEFNNKGGQIEKNRKEFNGEYASSMRSFLSNKNEQERDNWLVDDYQKNVSNAVSPDFEIQKLDVMQKKLVTTFEVEHQPFVALNENLIYTENDAWVSSELSNSIIENKHYGYWFTGLKVKSKYLIDIGSAWKLQTVGAELELVNKFGAMYRYIKHLDKQKLEYNTLLKIPAQYVEVADIPMFNQFIKTLKAQAQLQLTASVEL